MSVVGCSGTVQDEVDSRAEVSFTEVKCNARSAEFTMNHCDFRFDLFFSFSFLVIFCFSFVLVFITFFSFSFASYFLVLVLQYFFRFSFSFADNQRISNLLMKTC